MELTPRYDGPPILRVEIPVDDVSVPLLRQLRRTAAMLSALEPEQWAGASRCAGWSVQDVAAHLVGTNQFWALSIRSGLAGSPTRFLTTFDPVTTPELMVEPLRALAPSAVLDRFAESVDAVADSLAGTDASSWSRPAEAPPGHIALRAVALHALWDGWVHERDIALPLGLRVVEEPDEVAGVLVYAAALGPTLIAAGGSVRSGALVIDADNPALRFVVDAGASVVVRDAVAADAGCPRLSGRAVELIEGLSLRSPLRHDFPADDRWLLGGLAQAFGQTA